MNTTPVTVSKNLFVLAGMLERLERSGKPVDAGQYQALSARLSAELNAAPQEAALEAVLATFPAVAQLYENLNYQHAGLCRSPLDAALAAEVAARKAIEAARRAAPGPAAVDS
jgi:hypothetical protein